MTKSGKSKHLPTEILLRTGNVASEVNKKLVRCKSWFDHAGEVEMFRGSSDVDTVFILRWIALGCLYEQQAKEMISSEPKQNIEQLIAFADTIIQLDTNQTISAAISTETKLILRFANSDYIEQKRYPNSRPKTDRKKETCNLKQQIKTKNTSAATKTILRKLHLIRNQTFHGKEIWAADHNRQTIKDAANILKTLIPIFANLLPDHN